jgi:hypothetical protein
MRAAMLASLSLLLLPIGARPALAQPVVPGFNVETYGTAAGAESLSFDASGALFVGRGLFGGTGAETQKIHRIPPGGGAGVEYGDSAIPDPDGVLVDLDGSISGTVGAVVVCGDSLGSNGQIVAVLPNESLVTPHAASGVLSNPNYMRRGRDGVLISDSANQAIYEFVPPGPPVVLIPSPAVPGHLAVDALDRIYVSHADGVVRQYDADGALLNGSFAGVGSGQLPLAVAPGGAFGTDLYLLSPASGELFRIFSDGSSVVVGTGFPASVGGLEFGPDGALYVSVFDAGEVLRIAPPLDAFLCYKAKSTKGGDGFEAPPDLSLVDAFEMRETDVLGPKALCNPANLDGEELGDPSTHLESYAIKSDEKHEKSVGVRVTNRFGELSLDTQKGDRLLVPSAKGLVEPPGPLGPTLVDHFKCYKAKITKGTSKLPKGVSVTLADQFDETARSFDVKKPKHLCLPVNKNSEGFQRPESLLVCYQAKPAKGAAKHAKRSGLHLDNQFGTEQLDTKKEAELCVPSALAQIEG